MSQQYFTGKMVKMGDMLVWKQPTQSVWNDFKGSIPEHMLVDCYFEITHDDGTLAQLAKLHVMIRNLALHVGETFENMKLLVKDRAGLCINKNVSGREYFIPKSFGDCSKDELMLAIQACEELETLT